MRSGNPPVAPSLRVQALTMYRESVSQKPLLNCFVLLMLALASAA